MNYSEDIIKLRKKIQEAFAIGIVDTSENNFLEITLIQIMNESEKNRQSCIANAESLRKQAAVFDGQASGFASINSIIYNVVNGFVSAADKELKERETEEK